MKCVWGEGIWMNKVSGGTEWGGERSVICILHGGVFNKALDGQLETSCKDGKYILKMWLLL